MLRGLRALLAGLVIFAADPCRANEDSSGTTDFISSWLAMVERTQAEQPRWITPLATVTPRLEQEFRFDLFSESLTTHGRFNNYGGGKGIEFIPTERTEVFFGVPPYDTRTSAGGRLLAEGWGDWPVFLVKYRFLSANEDSGNYVVTGFFQLSTPTGNAAFSNHFYVLQPTVAFGKGWGDFDVQATVSEQFPTGGDHTAESNFGHPVLVNVAAQFHLWDVLWPELEANTTWWPDGTKGGKVQLFLTPGIIFGRGGLSTFRLPSSASLPKQRHRDAANNVLKSPLLGKPDVPARRQERLEMDPLRTGASCRALTLDGRQSLRVLVFQKSGFDACGTAVSLP